MGIINQIKAYFALPSLLYRLDSGKQYVWEINADSYEQVNRALNRILEFRRGLKSDVVVSRSSALRIIPADRIGITIKTQGAYKSKTHILNTIKEAIGDNWQDISELKLLPDYVEVIRFKEPQMRKQTKSKISKSIISRICRRRRSK